MDNKAASADTVKRDDSKISKRKGIAPRHVSEKRLPESEPPALPPIVTLVVRYLLDNYHGAKDFYEVAVLKAVQSHIPDIDPQEIRIALHLLEDRGVIERKARSPKQGWCIKFLPLSVQSGLLAARRALLHSAIERVCAVAPTGSARIDSPDFPEILKNKVLPHIEEMVKTDKALLERQNRKPEEPEKLRKPSERKMRTNIFIEAHGAFLIALAGLSGDEYLISQVTTLCTRLAFCRVLYPERLAVVSGSDTDLSDLKACTFACRLESPEAIRDCPCSVPRRINAVPSKEPDEPLDAPIPDSASAVDLYRAMVKGLPAPEIYALLDSHLWFFEAGVYEMSRIIASGQAEGWGVPKARETSGSSDSKEPGKPASSDDIPLDEAAVERVESLVRICWPMVKRVFSENATYRRTLPDNLRVRPVSPHANEDALKNTSRTLAQILAKMWRDGHPSPDTLVNIPLLVLNTATLHAHMSIDEPDRSKWATFAITRIILVDTIHRPLSTAEFRALVLSRMSIGNQSGRNDSNNAGEASANRTSMDVPKDFYRARTRIAQALPIPIQYALRECDERAHEILRFANNGKEF